ncbi:putative protein phosphatase 2C-type [Thalassoglobus neptunius]|uniref:PPM-type phosphatase domain-containing protein n=1 Tax=Thalassoglobus neptunius TaxID=1938619 RepID=A0A5C5X7M9_9PLAN|nr:putative protein phosphatase 2C-type [Thalassoglobus neptunius]
MFWEQNVFIGTETDIGLRRKNNEDSHSTHLCLTEAEWRRHGHLFIVADGMGGHAVGELASRIAVDTIPHTFLKSNERDVRTTLREAVLCANSAIHARGTQNEDFLHMGTTCTALTLSRQGAIVAHVGDSRAYRIRRDRIDQLTFDHSLEWELERNHHKFSSAIDLAQHKNIITRSLGPEPTVQVDVEGPYPVLPNDTFLLCSDGLSNLVADEEMGAIARELPPENAAKLLIHLANIRGGPDNSTVIIARVGELPANVEPEFLPEEPDDQQSLGWAWLIGFWVVAMFLAGGLSLLAIQRTIAGVAVTACSSIALLALLVASFRQTRQKLQSEFRSHAGRPHRTAVALDSKPLFERLAEISHDLQRAAREDGWNVNWKLHDQAIQAAESAAESLRYAKAVRHVSRAIDSLMQEHPHTASSPKP